MIDSLALIEAMFFMGISLQRSPNQRYTSDVWVTKFDKNGRSSDA